MQKIKITYPIIKGTNLQVSDRILDDALNRIKQRAEKSAHLNQILNDFLVHSQRLP